MSAFSPALPFSPLAIPIRGTNLIEASAGTGKTYSIAALFARLVLLERQSVDKILVVTFTEAATAELKTRLRARLEEAAEVLKRVPDAAGQPEILRAECGDDFLFDLLRQALDKEPQARLRLRLAAAVSHFDKAAIYTIHGFCQRVLQDFAFYCRVPFGITLAEEDGGQTLVTAQDFWRTEIASDRTLAELVYPHDKISPVEFTAALKPYLARPYLRFRQPQNQGSAPLENAKQAYEAAWAHARAHLAEAEAAFWKLHPALPANSYGKESFAKRFAALAAFSGYPAHETVWELLTDGKHTTNLFTAATLENKLKKAFKEGKEPYEAAAIPLLDGTLGALGEAAQAVAAAEQNVLIDLSHRFIAHLRRAAEEEKKRSPERSFDDLLLDVFHALSQHSADSAALAEALSRNWQTALIDEFQDTDPLQYAVFQAAFMQQNGRTALFLVGDPKQAIYSFRGADIFAYLAAARDAEHRYTLTQNFRSHAKLVNSTNALFSRPNPFVLPEIAFGPATAARAQSRLPQGNAAVRFTWLNEGADKENAETLEARAAHFCAKEIAASLNAAAAGRYSLRGETGSLKPLEAAQIAVLVRTRKEGTRMQRELKTLGVQSVLLSRESVFAEEEARAVFALMSFFLNPQQTRHLVYALSGCLFGRTAAEIAALNESETALSRWTDAAAAALQNWQRFGAYAALSQFLHGCGTETRLLAQGSLRTLTNLNQLLEILAAEDENARAPAALLQWFGAQMRAAAEGKTGADDKLLRLESDENLVKIVTMHASKGLQYPIVYCPFAWRAGSADKNGWRIIHTVAGSELVHKTQMSADDEAQSADERLSEDLRLLYVALTRAEEQLNIYLASCPGSASTALAYLSGCPEDTAKDPAAYARHWQEFLARHTAGTDFVWQSGYTPPQFAPAVSGIPHQTAPAPAYRAAGYPPRTYRTVSHTSFTALARQSAAAMPQEDALLPALDAEEQPPAAPLSGSPSDGNANRLAQAELSAEGSLNGADTEDIARFPQGAAAGICLHKILEQYRPAASESARRQSAAAILARHGFDEAWAGAVVRMAENTWHTPLLPAASLHTLPPECTVAERGFLLHTDHFRRPALKRWFAEKSRLPESIVQAAQHLSFRNVQGFIGGFIDLFALTPRGQAVVLDYKSNRLGETAADYPPAALDTAVAQHHYYLQALIYAVAAARHLAARQALPDTIHIRYLFLRGLDGISRNGVWEWDIAVKDLQEWL